MRILLVILTCLVSFHQVSAILPEVIRTCPRSSDHINECICESIELLRENLRTGDFGENFTIPKLEPLYIDEIKMHRNELKATFKNLQVTGPSLFTLKNMKAHVANKTFYFTLDLPSLEFKGDYTIALKLLVKISGNGKFKGAFKNSIAKVTALGTPSTDREGQVDFDLKVKLKVDYAHFQMESLSMFNSLGNRIINDNYKLFLAELVPGLEESLSRIFSDIVNSILINATYDEMFPE